MSKTALLCAVLLSLLPISAFANCKPGQDISARATVTWCGQKQLSVGAAVIYVDPSGNPGEQIADELALVQAETSQLPVTAGPATSFVAPAANAPVYFAVAKSFYSGASLAGKCVKLLGRIRTINGVRYIDDGSRPVCVRTDLLTSPPADGTLVTIEGVSKEESDGSLSLLPLANASVSRVQ